METIRIKLPDRNPLKETKEERKKRVQASGSSLITKIVPAKNKKTTKQQRQSDKLEIKKYI